MSDALMLSMAWLAACLGMSWLALSLPAHWEQVDGPGEAPQRRLRVLGHAGLLLSLGLCLRVDHVSMVALVWPMLLAVSALLVALLLAWQPRRLRPLARLLARRAA